MAALPKLTLAMPPSIKVSVLSDRTQTIRASVHDVQFTLMLTIALVVMVIFIFLRNLWATLIPSVTVPLALLGTCGVMWVAGYSLDNLSLMALTISVGFVVDDAIVMLENITRYIEEGETPMAAALKGSREIGFTIMSISISLIAVLIPLLMMGGIVGRLFREFSVTLAMTIGSSEAAQDISFADMLRHQVLLGDIVRKDPDVDHVAMSIGGGSALNAGRMYVMLKPRDQRRASADQIIARLSNPNLPRSKALACSGRLPRT